jgi:antitoxin HicB
MTNKRDLQYYMALPYRVEIAPTEDGTGFTATVPALKGCIAFGETVEEAYEMVAEVKEAWIDIALEEGWPIPEPTEEEVKEYSGRFNVRLPRYLHRRLAEVAEVEDTSLNQLVVALLSEGVERRRHRATSSLLSYLVRYSAPAQVSLLKQALVQQWQQMPFSEHGADVFARTSKREGEAKERLNRPKCPPLRRSWQLSDVPTATQGKEDDSEQKQPAFGGYWVIQGDYETAD